MSDQPTGQEETGSAIRETIAETLRGIPVAKSRRANNLSETEVEKIADAIVAVLPTTPEVVSAVDENQWFGIDRRNDTVYQGKMKTPVLHEWLKIQGIDPDDSADRKKVATVRFSSGDYHYALPRGIGNTQELRLLRRDNLRYHLTTAELQALGITGVQGYEGEGDEE